MTRDDDSLDARAGARGAGDTVHLPYRDRTEGGRVLARAVRMRAEMPAAAGVQVLALPRGGVPVACELAADLGFPLDVYLVRKLGVPGHEELAMGAVAGGEVEVLNHDLVQALGIPGDVLRRLIDTERNELARRERLYRGGRPLPEVEGRIVILVDDGLATGSSMQAAAIAIRNRRPARVLVAVPVAPVEAVRRLEQHADQVICPATPEPFIAVGRWYTEFHQMQDREVRELLERAWRGVATRAQQPDGG